MHTFLGGVESHTSECRETTAMYQHGKAATVCESGAIAIGAIAFASAKAKNAHNTNKRLEAHWTRNNTVHLENCASPSNPGQNKWPKLSFKPPLVFKTTPTCFQHKVGVVSDKTGQNLLFKWGKNCLCFG